MREPAKTSFNIKLSVGSTKSCPQYICGFFGPLQSKSALAVRALAPVAQVRRADGFSFQVCSAREASPLTRCTIMSPRSRPAQASVLGALAASPALHGCLQLEVRAVSRCCAPAERSPSSQKPNTVRTQSEVAFLRLPESRFSGNVVALPAMSRSPSNPLFNRTCPGRPGQAG